MITVFNRRQVFVTYDMKKQAQIREILAANGIDYYVKTVNRQSSSALGGSDRARTGTLGQRLDLAYEYIFYVRKVDFERARNLIG